MRMILESARVWQNCVFLLLDTLRHASVWGIGRHGVLLSWLNTSRREERKETSCKYNILLFFYSLQIHLKLRLLPADSRLFVLGAQSCFPVLLNRGELRGPDAVFTALPLTWITSKAAWKDLRNLSDSRRASALSACPLTYWFSRFIECGGMCCSTQQQICGLYFHLAGRFY